MAEDEVRIQIDPAAETNWQPVVMPQDYERWNDWGIGLLLQGDLKGAEYAFLRVTEANPQYADGWINVARALIEEGEIDRARRFIEKAMNVAPRLVRANFFLAMVEKAEGNYDRALELLLKVTEKYPKDRVVWNQIGRIYFLKREFQEAVEAFQRVLKIDPEDVQAHYNLMLSYRGLGNIERSRYHEKLFRRYKADEAAQELTFRRRMISPEDNNERQLIHEHVSIPLPRDLRIEAISSNGHR